MDRWSYCFCDFICKVIRGVIILYTPVIIPPSVIIYPSLLVALHQFQAKKERVVFTPHAQCGVAVKLQFPQPALPTRAVWHRRQITYGYVPRMPPAFAPM